MTEPYKGELRWTVVKTEVHREDGAVDVEDADLLSQWDGTQWVGLMLGHAGELGIMPQQKMVTLH